MLEALNAHQKVLVFDVAPRLGALGLSQRGLTFLLTILRGRCSTVYVALSGGKRQLIDLLFLLLARLGRRRIFIHHHSFAYLNVPTIVSRLCLHLAGQSTHIVLCPRMAELLSDHYQIPAERLRVLSNAAFSDDAPAIGDTTITSELRIGFLSNLTREKGVFEFLSVANACQRKGISLAAYIAGPLSDDIREDFEASIKDTNVRYVGAVYGCEKANFFRTIDVLVFPSSYLNEAEPVVVLEALSYGVTIICTSRGCLPSMMENGGGIVIKENFVTTAVEELTFLSNRRDVLARRRRAARSASYRRRAHSRRVLNQLLQEFEAAPRRPSP
jgi:glycosyltransferase involved in cell wall biosynthesis